jgi:anti-sigma regulatory factor (Ser/Thr protein kinase)
VEVSRSRVVLLPYTAASVGVARRRIVADLLSAGTFESVAADAAIVVTELITNALRHARPLPGAVIRVGWLLSTDNVEVEVSDGGGATTPTLSDPVQSATSGRGLGIVDRLSRQWGVRQAEGEMTVWAQVPVPLSRDIPGGDAIAPGDRARNVTHATSDA